MLRRIFESLTAMGSLSTAKETNNPFLEIGCVVGMAIAESVSVHDFHS